MGHDAARAAMIYQNSRELHQAGEELQVAWWEQLGNGDARPAAGMA